MCNVCVHLHIANWQENQTQSEVDEDRNLMSTISTKFLCNVFKLCGVKSFWQLNNNNTPLTLRIIQLYFYVFINTKGIFNVNVTPDFLIYGHSAPMSRCSIDHSCDWDKKVGCGGYL